MSEILGKGAPPNSFRSRNGVSRLAMEEVVESAWQISVAKLDCALEMEQLCLASWLICLRMGRMDLTWLVCFRKQITSASECCVLYIYVCVYRLPNTNYERNGTFSRLKHQATKTCMENPKKNVAHSQLELHITGNSHHQIPTVWASSFPPWPLYGANAPKSNTDFLWYYFFILYPINNPIHQLRHWSTSILESHRTQPGHAMRCSANDFLCSVWCRRHLRCGGIHGNHWKPRFNRDTWYHFTGHTGNHRKVLKNCTKHRISRPFELGWWVLSEKLPTWARCINSEQSWDFAILASSI